MICIFSYYQGNQWCYNRDKTRNSETTNGKYSAFANKINIPIELII